VLLSLYGGDAGTLAELADDPRFSRLVIYEPGVAGPFRRLLRRHETYINSYFWRDVPLGEMHEGVRCEDLQRLTFEDRSVDLIISSDILEHVRDPRVALAETFRVLRPGGRHVFTVPFKWPFLPKSVARVDTSGTEDVDVLPPVYHGSPIEPEGSLVYTDFGMDLPEILREIGFDVTVHHGYRNNVTIVSQRPFGDS
jgi:SAM-dependent methyltransferase